MVSILKFLGWLLLLGGLILIGWTLLRSYSIFTTKSQAPEFFKTPAAVSLPAPQQGAKLTPEEIQAQLQKVVGEQLKGILPADSITRLLNLIVWSILASILIFGGGQIAGIGVKMIKK